MSVLNKRLKITEANSETNPIETAYIAIKATADMLNGENVENLLSSKETILASIEAAKAALDNVANSFTPAEEPVAEESVAEEPEVEEPVVDFEEEDFEEDFDDDFDESVKKAQKPKKTNVKPSAKSSKFKAKFEDELEDEEDEDEVDDGFIEDGLIEEDEDDFTVDVEDFDDGVMLSDELEDADLSDAVNLDYDSDDNELDIDVEDDDLELNISFDGEEDPENVEDKDHDVEFDDTEELSDEKDNDKKVESVEQNEDADSELQDGKKYVCNQDINYGSLKEFALYNPEDVAKLFANDLVTDDYDVVVPAGKEFTYFHGKGAAIVKVNDIELDTIFDDDMTFKPADEKAESEEKHCKKCADKCKKDAKLDMIKAKRHESVERQNEEDVMPDIVDDINDILGLTKTKKK